MNMAEQFEQTFGPIMRKQTAALRSAIRFACFAMAMAILAGALMTWSAIDYWLTGRPFLSAVFTVLAFANFVSFSSCIATRRSALTAIAKWRDAERMWKQTP